MTKLLENQDSRGQWIWVLLIRIVGVIMFVSPLYLPVLAYYSTSKETVSITFQDVMLMLAGLLLSSGGKQIGTFINNIGIAAQLFLNKLVK